jgi:hypothetical protein
VVAVLRWLRMPGTKASIGSGAKLIWWHVDR